MTKPTMTKLKLKNENKVEIIVFNETEIEVKQYLPTNEKYEIITIALEGSRDRGIFNPVKVDMYLHLFMVYLYTNINFTDKQKEDSLKIFDLLKESGLLDLIIDKIPSEEYEMILKMAEETEKKLFKYDRSIRASIESIKNSFNSNEITKLISDTNKLIEKQNK